MNAIELVTRLPNWRWKEHSANEIAMTGEEIVELSDVVWQIGNVAVAGFIYQSLLGPPWMWFVLAEDVTIGDLIDFRRLSSRIPKGTETFVKSSFTIALRFAKLYGFEEIGKEVNYFGHPYKLMRKV